MTYSVGSIILHDDYNIFATGSANGSATNSANVNNIWGTGTGQYGWGQSTTVTAVSQSGLVYGTEWNTLTSRINSIRSHQTGSGITFTNTTGGATSNFTAAQIIYHVSNIASALNTAYTDANTASATTGSMACYSTVQQGTTTTLSKTLSNTVTTQFDIDITFTSDAAMRYFFNSGGYLEFAFSMTNSGTAKTQSWSNLASDLGLIRFGGLASVYSGYSGTWDTNANYYLQNAPASATTWWKKFNDTGTADYNLNYIYCTVAKSSGVLNFKIYAVDAAADTFDDTITNPLICSAKVYEAGTNYINKTWGTATVSTS